MPVTINSATPTAANRADFNAAFHPGSSINGTTTLTWPAAGGVQHEVNSATAVTLTLPSGSIPVGARIEGLNIGVGAVSFAASGGESIVGNAILPATVAQYDPFEFRRISGNRWARVA